MIEYDSEGRAYWNGKRVARVSEVCQLLAPRIYIPEYYKRKGTLIHLITEYEDEGTLDESSVDPSLIGYLTAYRKFKKETGWIPLCRETSFYSAKYGFCGRADSVGQFLMNSIWTWVLDIKSGQPHEADKYQGPAYLFGLKGNAIEAQKCADLYLKANGNYQFREIKNPTDIFLKFLYGLRKWQEENHCRRII